MQLCLYARVLLSIVITALPCVMDYIMRFFYVILSGLRNKDRNVDSPSTKGNNFSMTAEPMHVTDGAFEKIVMQSEVPVIVDFWAPWCNPCKMIAPTLEKLAKEQDGKLIVAKVNTDENPEWMNKFGVQGIPTLLFVSGGKVVHRQVGALPERMLREAVAEFMDVIQQN